MTPLRARWRRALPADPSRLAWVALAGMLALTAVFLFRETRGTTFSFDEWIWALDRRGNTLHTFLAPHNSHLSLVPLALYKLLFATAGLRDYVPYRVLVIAAHLACTTLLFVYARRRVGDAVALMVAALMAFYGPGWQNELWPFGITYLLTLGSGVAAFLMLDRRDRLGDGAACALLALSLASSGLGVAVALGVIVDVLWGRRRCRDAWIFAVPLALYAVWWVLYQENPFFRHNLVVTPGFVADGIAASIAGLVGLAGPTQAAINGPGTLLDWGRPLALAAAALVVWRLSRLRPIPPRALSLLTVIGTFWVFTAVNRAQISPAYASRYLYVSALFLLMLAVELARGLRVPWRADAMLAVGVAAALVTNFGVFRDGARYLRAQARDVRADLGALEIARRSVDPHLILTTFPGYPLLRFDAGSYFVARRALGTPAASPSQIDAEPEDARRLADLQLIAAQRVGLAAAPAGLGPGAPPAVAGVSAGTASRWGHCVSFRPAPATAAAPPPVPGAQTPVAPAGQLDLRLPSTGLALTAAGGPANVSVRRFGDEFEPVGTLGVSGSAVLRIAPDLSGRPWWLRLAPLDRATACGLGAPR